MTDPRAALEKLMRATLDDERRHRTWDYTDSRPQTPEPAWKPGQHVRSDCSKGVQRLCKWAGAPDPMGNDFGPWGNSATIALHLHHASTPSLLEVGDVVTFGPYGNEHAAMVLEAGADPLLWSDGHQGAPNTYRLSWDTREKQYLRLPVAPHKPTTEQVLRKRTGWFAWAAWRLGEGPWKPYGKAAASVRPDVPAVIPAGWWIRLGRFLASRKHGNKPRG